MNQDSHTIYESEKKDLIEIFEDVKEIVEKSEKKSRGGLMLGLQALGISPQGFIGGYYPLTSNIIVMNKTPFSRIRETNSQLLKPYATHILLHEYLHSLGIIDEDVTRRKTLAISKNHFGNDHPITQMAFDMKQFFPYLVYPQYGWHPSIAPPIEIVKGFDRSSMTPYIA